MPKKTIAQILDDAAGIIEKRGKCEGHMYAEHIDKFCSIGAIARATYSKRAVPDSLIEHIAWMRPDDLDRISYADVRDVYDPRFAEAMQFAAEEARSRYNIGSTYDNHAAIYDYNDRESITAKHAGNMLRAAAKRAREAAKKVKATA